MGFEPARACRFCRQIVGFVYKLSTKREWVYEPARPSGAEPVNNQLSGQRFEITVSTSYSFRRKHPLEIHRVLSPVSQTDDKGAGAKTQCKCTCRRGSGPSAPARARFMGLIGCSRVLCRAVSCSSGMPDDNSEARALCVRRQCSRAAGSQ